MFHEAFLTIHPEEINLHEVLDSLMSECLKENPPPEGKG